jgi:predicted MFS family arabinose efflux permease
VNAGIGGSYLAFAGLWAVPFLEQAYAMSRVAAAEHASALLLGVAFGALGIGALSDRLRNRRALMRAYTLLFALSWLPWLLHAAMAVRRDARLVRADGLADTPASR